MLKSLKHFDLKTFRKSLRMTQAALGEAIGVSGNLISSMELGKAQMTLDTFDKIRTVFPGINLAEFQLESPESIVSEPGSSFLHTNNNVLFEMYQDKDKQLSQCNEEKAALLREIIRLKDELAASNK